MLRGRLSPAAVDGMCLFAVTILSAAPYIGSLGLYSDDWAVLGGFEAAAAAGQFGLGAIFDGFAARPLQGLYLAGLYLAFGFQPLGYHLVNLVVLAASFPLLYLLLLRLGTGRRDALAASVIFLVLPQLSTVRVWISASQIPLAMMLALVSLNAQLAFSSSRRSSPAALALAAALLSVAAYETFAPLLAGFALWLALRHNGSRRRAMVLLLIVVVMLAAAIFKWSVSGRVGTPGPDRYIKGLEQLFRTDYDWRFDFGLNLFAAIETHFWEPFRGWAAAALQLVELRTAILTIAAALAVGLVAFWRLLDAPPQARSGQRILLFAGAGALFLGHAVFLTAPALMFSPTGMANRALVAAAIGVALLVAWLIAVLGRLLPARIGRIAYCATVAAIAVLGTVRDHQIAGHWAQASAEQAHILRLARTDLARLPAGAIVILDGVCPYRGPGVVFETSWDVAGALGHVLGRPVGGDVVSTRLQVTGSGLATSIYKVPAFYPFGPALYIYNPNLRLVRNLADETSARAYFARPGRWPRPCVRGYVGHGATI